MNFFDNLAKLDPFPGSAPFPALQSIKWRADQMLKNRKATDLENAAKEIRKAIDNFKTDYVAEQTEKYIDRLSEHGGWELSYLDRNSIGTRAEIRDLIENWSPFLDDKPDVPSEDDLSDLEALQEVIGRGDAFHEIDGFPALRGGELYAVLALMLLDYAVRWLHSSSGTFYAGSDLSSTKNAINAANLLLEALETVSYAERELSDVELRALRAEEREQLAAEIEAETRTEHARMAALARHAQTREAKAFVASEWKQHREAYEGNKSAFARDYVKRIHNEYSVAITEKQMREVWLKDPPSAGRRAGMPADG